MVAAKHTKTSDLDMWMNTQAPYSQEAEEATLGAVLAYPALFYTIAASLKADDFFIVRHRYIWDAMVALNARGEPIEYVTVRTELEAQKRFADVGGGAYLTQLINNTPSASHGDVYAKLVERFAVRRRLLAASHEIKNAALDTSVTTEQALAAADRALLDVSNKASSTGFTSFAKAVSAHFERAEDAVLNPREIIGIPSAFKDVNAYLRGWRPEKLYVIAGRPGMGKSSFLITELAHMARMGMPVALFTQEMGIEEVTDSIVAAETGINADAVSTGKINPQEWTRYVEVSGRIQGWPIFIDDSPVITPAQIRLKTRRLIHEHGCKALFIDYIQLVSGGGEINYGNRDQEVGYITRTLKQISKEFRIPVIAAAQLSRDLEKRQDKRPMLSDLRESGNIENDADVVLFLYRDDYYNPVYPPAPVSLLEAGIAKHRGGRKGVIELGFKGELKKIVEIEKQSFKGAV